MCLNCGVGEDSWVPWAARRWNQSILKEISWMFIGRTDIEAEMRILWPLDSKSWLIWKDLDAGKDWRQEEKGMTEDEMIGWHHRLYGQEFEQTSEVGDGQGSLTCCSPWDRKKQNTTELSHWTELNWTEASIWLQPIDGSVTPVPVCSWMHHSLVNQDYKAEDLEHRDGGCLSSSFSQYCSLLLALVQPWITDPWRKAIKDFQGQMESLVWWSNPCRLNSPLRPHLGHLLSWLRLAG